MRRYFLSFGMIMSAAFGFAQKQSGPSASIDVVHEKSGPTATLTLLNSQPAVVVVLPYAPATVVSAMQEYEVNCYKPKKKQSSAYVAFDETPLMKNNKTGANMIFKVGPMGMQQQEQSVVYLLLNSPIEKGDYAGATNRFDANEAIAYLNNLSVAIQHINLDHQIKANTAKLKKEEHLQSRYAKRCDKLTNRKEAIQSKLAAKKNGTINRDRRLSLRLSENQNALALHKSTIEKHRKDLMQLTNQKERFKNK